MRRLYAILLLLYPAPFRRRYGTELLEAFDDERREARHRGFRGGVALWRHILADLLAAALRQRWRAVAQSCHGLMGTGAPQLPHSPGRGFMETLVQDVAYSLRQFVRLPAFTAVAVLSLALGIGANSVIFGLLDGFVLNPFPYPDPSRLVSIGASFPKVSSETPYVEALSTLEYLEIRKSRSFSRIGAFDLGNRNISGGDVPERVFTALVLDDLFPVVGLKPHLGRGFTPEELVPRGPDVAIISYRLWQSRFSGDPRIINRAIRIGGVAHTVVGVMPKALTLIGTDLWIPWGGDPEKHLRTARQFTVLARLAPDATLASANAELATLASQVHQAHGAAFSEYEGWRLTATPWAAAVMQDARPVAFVLLGAVGFVLLIACVNLANLMLARATTRHRELAVRLALGASRWRIARQWVTESLLLALAGSAGGLALAAAGLRFGDALVPPQLQALGLHAALNGRVLAWNTGVAALAGLLVSVLPALHASRTDPHESLKSDGRSGVWPGATRTRHGLIVAEIALSVVLLLGAGLLMRSFINLQRSELGFEPRGVLTMRLTLPQEKYPSGEAVTVFFEELTGRLGTLPGVTAAAVVSTLPPGAPSNTRIEVEGLQVQEDRLATSNVTIASREYFAAVQVPLLRGRAFGVQDTPAAPPRVIVNQAFVTRFMGDRDPLATRVRINGRGGPGPWMEVVGVAGNARNSGAAAPVRPEIFVPMEQGRDGWNQLYLLVRTGGDPASLLSQVRSVVASIDPEQPVYAIRTLEEAVAVSILQQRVAMVLLSIFAATALALAAIGIYGVMSYSVSMRTQEIGVRMAVGAERSDVIRLVLAQVLKLSALGLIIGVGALMAAGKVLSRMLYGVTPSDPLTLMMVAVVLGSVALLAGWIPAWRASRVSPIQALRYE